MNVTARQTDGQTDGHGPQQSMHFHIASRGKNLTDHIQTNAVTIITVTFLKKSVQ